MEPTESILYTVVYRVSSPGWPDRDIEGTVIITPGYTTVADIPKILSLVRGFNILPQDIEIKSVSDPRPY